MKRRKFFAYVGAAGGLPAAVRAQQPGRIYRIGVLVPVAKDDQSHQMTLAGLKSMGFVDGKNLIEDLRGFSLHPDQMAAAARDLIAAKVDLLMAGGGPAVRAAQTTSNTVPIVGVADDMIREGLVSSLANRGGNTTGISFLSTELDGKRQELLLEFLPKAQKMALLADAGLLQPEPLKVMQERARASGVDLSVLRIAKPGDIEPALDGAKAAGAQAINILASPMLFSARAKIFAKSTALGLPTMYQWAEGVNEGAAICYGPSFNDTFQQWGRLTAKVLRGGKPGDLPIEQPTSFKLTINQKLAKALGITVPSSMLQRADEVVE